MDEIKRSPVNSFELNWAHGTQGNSSCLNSFEPIELKGTYLKLLEPIVPKGTQGELFLKEALVGEKNKTQKTQKKGKRLRKRTKNSEKGV